MSKTTKETTKKTEDTPQNSEVSTEEVKNQLGTKSDVLPIEGDPQGNVTKDDGIIIGEPLDLTPKNLPLVVKLPDNASSAQVEYAKILNAYAYQNPKKWAKKKDVLVNRLKLLAGHEVQIDPNVKLTIRGSAHSFYFVPVIDPKTGKRTEVFAPSASVKADV